MPSLDPLNTRCGAWHDLNAAAPRPKNKNEHVRSDPPTHIDIVKHYRKGLTAVVDRCVYISYNRYHSVPKSFIYCCSGLDSCMLTSRCMLPWLRSAPYPALCPCEPLRPVRRHASRVLWRSFQTVQSTAGLQLATSIYRRATTLRAHG